MTWIELKMGLRGQFRYCHISDMLYYILSMTFVKMFSVLQCGIFSCISFVPSLLYMCRQTQTNMFINGSKNAFKVFSCRKVFGFAQILFYLAAF